MQSETILCKRVPQNPFFLNTSPGTLQKNSIIEQEFATLYYQTRAMLAHTELH